MRPQGRHDRRLSPGRSTGATRLPGDVTILIGEPDAMGYDALQDAIGTADPRRGRVADDRPCPRPLRQGRRLGAGASSSRSSPTRSTRARSRSSGRSWSRWPTITMRSTSARARELLGWEPRHRIRGRAAEDRRGAEGRSGRLVRANGSRRRRGSRPPPSRSQDPEELRARHEDALSRASTAQTAGRTSLNIGLGTWLITRRRRSATSSRRARVERRAVRAWRSRPGASVAVLALPMARWAAPASALWVMCAPFLFWTPNAAAYLTDTLVGALVIGFAVGDAARRPGVDRWPPRPAQPSRRAGATTRRAGRSACRSSCWPSSACYVSRYLAAYQLGHIDGVWEPFFAGVPGSAERHRGDHHLQRVAKPGRCPMPRVGALTYMLEILTGIVGSARRWRTMPWLVRAVRHDDRAARRRLDHLHRHPADRASAPGARCA